ncbi:hypothetical protein CVIRNUC_001424 [Coccomyxa viridis]|uniref:GTPase Era n=1 Tax=Coccomyxa viridis TaxID=1274662 RepID=A0AAV1HVC8_9CHLO|nr:hypothetical protein CVIRNUC_001424 [Coccomyxa viridis]
MLRGEVLLNSTRCSNPQCRREIQALAFLKRIHRESTSARKELVIRCARQRPQRSTTPKPGPVYVPSNGAGGQSDEESSFLESSPNHRAGYVAIVGKPNSGKSTLLNAILKQKLSIVTSKAQTTRHRIIAVHSEEDFQCIFLDTPGVLRPVNRPEDRSKLDERMMRSVKLASRDADAMLVVVDASDRPEQTLAFLQPIFDSTDVPKAVVLNKVDLLFDKEVEDAAQVFRGVPSVETVIPISAAKQRNVTAVEEWAVSHLPLGPALYPKDAVSEHPERFFVAEIIREKLFLSYGQEVPYCCSVQVTAFVEHQGTTRKDNIDATIFVEQESQKGIVIGRGGSALKALGTAARAEIEHFLGRPVYLGLTVKVKQKWRKSEEALNELGY